MTSRKRVKTPGTNSLFYEAEKFEEIGDFRNAFKCFLTAAQLGDTWGQVNLGNFYARGTGVRRSLRRAAYWYKKAYNNGNSCGALNLAIDRRNQGRIRSAVIWFKKAAEMNDGAACIELAKIYKARKGRQKTAADLLRLALRMSKDHISEDARREAESLIKETANSRNNNDLHQVVPLPPKQD